MSSEKVQYILLGAYGFVGKFLQNMFYQNGLASNVSLVGNGDELPEYNVDKDYILINATNVNGDNLEVLLSRLMKRYRDPLLIHISSTAIGNGTDYADTKLSDELIVKSVARRSEIVRLGVPVEIEGGRVFGVGYWDTLNISKSYGVVISLNETPLHSDKLFESIIIGLSNTKVAINLIKIKVPKKIRNLIPFRSLNKILSQLNLGVVG